jgi:hypothetical protein
VSIIFGEINLQGTKEEAHIKNKAVVVMSWEHAKALIGSLQKIIEEYKRTNGPIRNVPRPA